MLEPRDDAKRDVQIVDQKLHHPGFFRRQDVDLPVKSIGADHGVSLMRLALLGVEGALEGFCLNGAYGIADVDGDDGQASLHEDVEDPFGVRLGIDDWWSFSHGGSQSRLSSEVAIVLLCYTLECCWYSDCQEQGMD